MRKFKSFFVKLKAATAIEYGLIAGLIAIVIIVGLRLFGDETTVMYSHISSAVSSANSSN